MKILQKSYATYNEEHRRVIDKHECVICKEKFEEGDKLTIAHDYESKGNVRLHDRCVDKIK